MCRGGWIHPLAIGLDREVLRYYSAVMQYLAHFGMKEISRATDGMWWRWFMTSCEIKHGSTPTSQYICTFGRSCDQVLVGHGEISANLLYGVINIILDKSVSSSMASNCACWLVTLHRLFRGFLISSQNDAEVWISIWATCAMSVHIAILDDHSWTVYRRCRLKWRGRTIPM